MTWSKYQILAYTDNFEFWTKFTPKVYFRLKTEQEVQRLKAFAFCVINVNSPVVFEHFEDLKNLIILNISKEKLSLTSWALFILKLHKVFQTAL